MHATQLDPTTAADLRTLAHLTGRREPLLLQEVVAAYLQDTEDARAADAILDRIEAGDERTLTLDEFGQPWNNTAPGSWGRLG